MVDKQSKTPAPAATASKPSNVLQESKVTIEKPQFDAADTQLVRQAMLDRIQSRF